MKLPVMKDGVQIGIVDLGRLVSVGVTHEP